MMEDTPADAAAASDDPRLIEAETAEDDPPLEEIEHEGRVYQVPQPLKEALAERAEAAEQLRQLRQALESQRAQVDQHDAVTAHGRGRLAALDARIAEQEATDWDARDPGASQSAWRRLQQLKDERGAVALALTHLDEERQRTAQDDRQRRLREGHAVLAKDIAGWSPELGARLMAFGRESFGFTPDELAAIDDPRMVKVLHAAFSAGEAERARRLEDSARLRPVTRVGAGARAGFDPERSGIDDWMKFRNGQVRKRR